MTKLRKLQLFLLRELFHHDALIYNSLDESLAGTNVS